MADTSANQPPSRPKRRFHEAAVKSGLVTASDLAAAEDVAQARLRGVTPEADPERQFDATVAKVLVEQAKITNYQAEQLLLGRTRFHLDKYVVIDSLGRGGMGDVFEAVHVFMGRHVAVKVLKRDKAKAGSDGAFKREEAFKREMRILGRLDHENIVRAFDAGYDAERYYLVTELVPGMDVRRHVRKYGPLDEIVAASVFTQVAKALAFAHSRGLVHRDVKPGNILVMDDGRVKLLDLGLAGSSLEAEAIRMGRIVGTMDYVAPEQTRAPDGVGPAADVYALGCSMYFALTGQVPFPGGDRDDKIRRHRDEAPVPLQRLAPQVSQPFCQVVEAMMAKAVANRIGSAEEAIKRLARWTPDRPVPAPRNVQRPSAGAVRRAASSRQDDSLSESERGDSAWPLSDPSPDGDGPAGSAGTDAPDPWATWEKSLEPQAVLRIATRVLGPAGVAGLGLWMALKAMWWLAPAAFDGVFRMMTPAVYGCAVFLVVAAMQVAGILRDQSRSS